METTTERKNKTPIRYMTPLQLTHHRMALETLDGGCQDADTWDEIAHEFRRRGMLANAEKCQGRANYYRGIAAGRVAQP